jgi:peptide/nickel transport system permease protein
MLAYIVRRTIAASVLVALLSFVLFSILQAMPGSMEDMLMSGNPNIRPEDVARLKALRGLDQPVHVQYYRWMVGYDDTTDGDDELYVADAQEPLIGRLLDTESNLASRHGLKWSTEGDRQVLEGALTGVVFVASDTGKRQVVDAQRIVRRRVALARAPQKADFLVPIDTGMNRIEAGAKLGTFYQVTIDTLEALGLQRVKPTVALNDAARADIDPTEAAVEAGSNKPEGEPAALIVAPEPEQPRRFELKVMDGAQALGTLVLDGARPVAVRAASPANKEGKMTEAQVLRAQEDNLRMLLQKVAAHAVPLADLDAPMAGYVSLNSSGAQLVSPWRGIGLVNAGKWKGGLLSGNLGWSLKQERVSTLIQERIWNTFRLMAPALFISIFLALPLGMIAAVKQYSAIDHSVNMAAFVGISLPVHWFGLMLIHVFAVWLGWFPVSGIQTPGVEGFADKLWYTVLPVVVLSIAYIGRWLRYMRASMLEVIKQDYIRTARAKGLSERRVILVHAFRNALIPVVTVLALSVPVLFGGALITETVFSWPGMGSLIFEAIIGSDYYVAIIGFLISAILVMVANLLADLLYAVIDPRVRVGG